MPNKYDFSGWATKFNIKCKDGRTIRPEAFESCDGMVVPLVWGHEHNEPGKVLGHALLENRSNGVYMYGSFNATSNGQDAKEAVRHKDVTHLSIYANDLQHNPGTRDVVHGMIREVSLVLAGANPGAVIDNPILAHSDELCEEEARIYIDDNEILMHEDKPAEEEPKEGEKKMADGEKSIKDVFDTLNEDQKNVVYYMIGKAIEDAKGDSAQHSDDYDGGNEMKHNIFDNDQDVMSSNGILSHDDMMSIISDAKRMGSLKESFLAHAEDSGDPEYGIQDIQWLFPDFKNLNNVPEFIKRPDDWVTSFMNGVHHTPFSRIKSQFADITEDQARAKGYIKGKLKKEEVFSLLKRTTTPCTIYKKQKLDRDDIIDIIDFDVVAWLKTEMRMMLNEEIARAALISDGRLASDDDKIPEDHVRPIVNDSDLFVIRWSVGVGSSSDERAKNFIRAAIKARKNYKGSGRPTLWTTEDMLTDMLLLEDSIGHAMYKTETELATKLRVSNIVTVPVMEGFKDKDGKGVLGIIVNLSDYNIGADKGGAINMFDDFDIDYNQQKYLIETRISGALTKPFSAIVLREGTDTKSDEPTWEEIKEAARQ